MREGDGEGQGGAATNPRSAPWRVTRTQGEGNKSGQEGDREVFLSFASICFLIFFCFYHLIQETLTELQNRGKRQLRFEIAGVKSQSLKRRDKITITL